LKLGLVTAIDSEAKTVILAASLVLHEDAPSFKWVFNRFKEFFGDPRIVFTDSDPAMANAIFAVRLTSLSRLNFPRGFLQSRRIGPNMGTYEPTWGQCGPHITHMGAHRGREHASVNCCYLNTALWAPNVSRQYGPHMGI
jgi:hypothetical protein